MSGHHRPTIRWDIIIGAALAVAIGVALLSMAGCVSPMPADDQPLQPIGQQYDGIRAMLETIPRI